MTGVLVAGAGVRRGAGYLPHPSDPGPCPALAVGSRPSSLLVEKPPARTVPGMIHDPACPSPGPAAASCPEPGPDSIRVGWLEWAEIAEAGGRSVEAKVDSGAATSSLDARNITPLDVDGHPWVRFDLPAGCPDNPEADVVSLRAPVVETRPVRSSNGVSEDRVVVLLHLTLAGRRMPVEVTLTNRSRMIYRMLLGRELLSRGFLVDCSATHLAGQPDLTDGAH